MVLRQNMLVGAVLVASLSYYGFRIFRAQRNSSPGLASDGNRQRLFFGIGLTLFLVAPVYFAIVFRLYPYPAQSNNLADLVFGLICPTAGGLLIGRAIWLFEKQKRELI